MKRLWAAVAAFSSCIAPVTADAAPDPDSEFDRVVRLLGYSLTDPGEAHYAGRLICRAVDAGVSWEELAVVMAEKRYEPGAARAFVAAAVYAYCPWNDPKAAVA